MDLTREQIEEWKRKLVEKPEILRGTDIPYEVKNNPEVMMEVAKKIYWANIPICLSLTFIDYFSYAFVQKNNNHRGLLHVMGGAGADQPWRDAPA